MSKKNNKQYLLDIIDSINAIFDFINNMDFETFKSDRKTYSAVLREFIIIGEAISKIDEQFKIENKSVEWQLIKDFRNFIIHEYFGIDLEIVWDVIQKELDNLKNQIINLL